MTRIRQVRKRDGRLVPFDRSKIADAIFRAARSVGGEDRFLAEELAGVVVMHLERRGPKQPTPKQPTIEDVQDVVERMLIETGHARTAKAYILYRERRAAARATRAAAAVGAGLLVGGDLGGDPGAFSKGELVEVLVAVEELERSEAEEVARAVEERLLASAQPRVSRRTVTALVEAELFDRGREGRLGEEVRFGIREDEIGAWLDRRPDDRRADDPAAFAEAIGETALTSYMLAQVLPAGVAEAHRVGDLHGYDLGAPLAFTSLVPPFHVLLDRHLSGGDVSRAGGPRRFAGCVGELLRRYGPFAGRVLALEDLNVFWAPFVSHLRDEDALAEEVRELLLSPSMGAFPRRGGLLELELGVAAEVPARLARRPVPAPAPPGRTYGDYADAAREVGRILLREVTALRRRATAGGPRLTLVLPRRGERDAAARALVREALAAAAEVGDPLVVFEEQGAPSRGSRWYRLRDPEAPDPLRFPEGDVSAATATAVNLVGAALRAGRGGTEAFLAEIERLVRLALDGAAARRALFERSGEEPGRTLYPLRRGPVPLVDLDAAAHLVEPVGLEWAVEILEPDTRDPKWRAAFRERILRHLQERAALEAEARGLQSAVSESLSDEPARRFATLDAARFGQAAAWWEEGREPTYATPAPAPGESRREPTVTGRRSGARSFQRVRHRVFAERRPAVGDLLAALDAAADDASVVEYALEPWPHRCLRAASP